MQPTLQSSGGRVLKNPHVVVVTFAGDDMASDIETFSSKIGASLYWNQTAAQYGVGKLTATDVRLTDAVDPAPAMIDDADIQTWLAGKLDGTHTAQFGTADESTIYAIYYPTGTTTTVDGGGNLGETSCQDFLGYHDQLTLRNGMNVAYAVIPRCGDVIPPLAGSDTVTDVAAHEYFEAATDPIPETSPGWDHVDADHYVWGFILSPEGADLCVDQAGELFVKPPDVGFAMQRIWSNANASAGHHPCAPTTERAISTRRRSSPTRSPSSIPTIPLRRR